MIREHFVDYASIMSLISQRQYGILPARGSPPKLLSDDTLPQLIQELGDKFPAEDITKWFHFWTSRPSYVALKRAGGREFDLFGFCGWCPPSSESSERE